MNDVEVKKNVIMRQADALACDQYRITLMRDGAGRNFSNYGTPEGEPERFFAVADILAAIPALRQENARGWNVFTTPISLEHHFLVIDDIPDPVAVERIEAAGYTPCLVQSSSDASIQAILRAPKLPGKTEQQAANKLVVALNQAYGDKKFQGVIHPFRLAGFNNKKPGRNNAFTKILAVNPGAVCAKAAAELESLRATFKKVEAYPSPVQIKSPVVRSNGSISATDAYISLRAGYEAAAERMRWSKDQSLIDWKCAQEMARTGHTEAEISAAIIEHSPNLAERHKDFEAYADGIARRAFKY